MSPTELSIIIINWNSAELLRSCLRSIYANTCGISYEIIVLDNASYDGSAELVALEFPEVMFLQAERNLGFAQGNNRAVDHSSGHMLLFLNADTEVPGPAIQQMVACMNSLPGAGALGPKLLRSDGSLQTNCIQAFPTITNQLLDSNYLRVKFPRWSLWGSRSVYDEQPHPTPVDGVVGACLMIRRNVFDQAGRFNPAYFMYAEDMDLCFKVQQLKKTNYYIGAAVVIHHGGRSASASSDRQWSHVVSKASTLQFMQLHRGRAYALAFRLLTAGAALGRIGAVRLASAAPGGPSRHEAYKITLAKWTRVLKWALGREAAMVPGSGDGTGRHLIDVDQK